MVARLAVHKNKADENPSTNFIPKQQDASSSDSVTGSAGQNASQMNELRPSDRTDSEIQTIEV